MEPQNPAGTGDNSGVKKEDDRNKPLTSAISDMHAEGIDVVADPGDAPVNEPRDAEAEARETAAAAAEAFADLERQTSLAREHETKPVLKEEPAKTPEPPKPIAPQGQPVLHIEDILGGGPKADVKNDPSIKPLRTFKSDAEEAVRYQNVSAIDIAVAEEKKREKAEPVPVEYVKEKRSHPGLLIFFVLILIAALGGGWYFWFFTSGRTNEPAEVKSQAPAMPSFRTIVPYAKASIVKIDDGDPLTLAAAKLSASDAPLGTIFAVIPTEGTSTYAMAPVRDVFKKTSMPGKLSRSLGSDYMIGAHMFDHENPFVILKNTFFQNAFAGMLEWEKGGLRDDFLPLVAINHPEETSPAPAGEVWSDSVVSNVDARILKNASGDVIIAYAFPDKDTVVIATATTTLKYVLDQLLTVRTIQ